MKDIGWKYLIEMICHHELGFPCVAPPTPPS